MNKTIGIIIVFRYQGEKILKNAVTDIKNATNWMKSFCGFIYIFTDIPENIIQIEMDQNIGYVHAHKKKDISDHLLSFFLLNIEIDNIVFYFSGHGLLESMETPSNEKIPFLYWKHFLIKITKNNTKILFILDSCEPSDMLLPYVLEEKSNFKFIKNRKNDYTERDILLITSSGNTEQSVAAKSGSLFSNAFFDAMKQMNAIEYEKIKKNSLEGKNPVPIEYNRNLGRLVRNISSTIRKKKSGFIQNISIYSSKYMDPLLDLWIGSKNSPNIYAMDNYLVITHHY